MNNLINNEQLMTVKEVAEVLNVSKRTIQEIVKKLFPKIVRKGITTYMNQKQVTRIKQHIEYSGRKDLANVRDVKNIKTDLEKAETIKLAFQYIQENYQEAKKQLEQQKHKVEFYDTVTQTDDWRDISEVAKILNLGYGNITLFKKLREDKILMKNNLPYQKYVTKEYFKIVEKPFYKGKQRCINYKTVASQKGLEYLNKKYKKK